MLRPTRGRVWAGDGPPDPEDYTSFENWLTNRPREWSVAIAARAALRALPLEREALDFPVNTLSAFRATAIARFAAKYPNLAVGVYAEDAALAALQGPGLAGRAASVAAASVATDMGAATGAGSAVYIDADTDDSVATDAVHVTDAAAEAAAEAVYVAATALSSSSFFAAVNHDAQRLHAKVLTAEELARDLLWPSPAPPELTEAWQRLVLELQALGNHWRVWTDWYQDIALHEPHRGITEAEDAAYTDIPGKLPWNDGAEAVNTEIARRLAELRGSKIPDQSPAPVQVEERDGKVAKTGDRDSALSASERDFKAWRDPVTDHIDELTASDFAKGTNHGRVRDRLMALGKFLSGEITEVKERQFRIGYEIERFEGLMAAYRSGGEDMPMLNAAQLEDLDRLRVALRMGIDKLERWSEFRKQANESTSGEADADRETVADAMDEMAAVMERRPQYFHPELPASFRFLAEAVRDRSGATRTIVFGAVKSAENIVSFLGQRALGIGKKSVEAVETHISKAVAVSLITGLSSAAVGLSRALPQGWVWLKPLLAALGVGG